MLSDNPAHAAQKKQRILSGCKFLKKPDQKNRFEKNEEFSPSVRSYF